MIVYISSYTVICVYFFDSVPAKLSVKKNFRDIVTDNNKYQKSSLADITQDIILPQMLYLGHSEEFFSQSDVSVEKTLSELKFEGC